MSEDVYAVPDLTKKVKHGRGEREVEMEERGENEDRGEWEERIVDLYGTAGQDFTVHDNPESDPAGTQQDAVGMIQENTAAQPQHGDLTKKVRHGRGEREVEMEERGENEDRGEWEERIVDLYGTAEDFTVHDNPESDPAGTQQDAVGMIQENRGRAQPQHGEPDESKKKRSRVAAVCLGIIITLCLLLSACVISVVVQYMVLVKDKNNLAKELAQIQISHNNLTEEKDQLQISFGQLQVRHSNLTEEKDQLQISFGQLQVRHSNLTEEKDQLQIRFGQLQVRQSNLTEEKDQLQLNFKQLEIRNGNLTELTTLLKTSFKELEIKNRNLTEEKKLLETSFKELEVRYTNLTEDPALLKKILCESHGFKFGGGLCYYISTERKTWKESRQDCIDKQSDLVVIKSKDKQNFVVSLKQMVWLGLTDIKKEGHWKWVDKTPLTTGYWNNGEPNNDNEIEDCAEMKGGGWNDVPCIAKKRWICEITVFTMN